MKDIMLSLYDEDQVYYFAWLDEIKIMSRYEWVQIPPPLKKQFGITYLGEL